MLSEHGNAARNPDSQADPISIELRGITRRFGKTCAVDNVSFTVGRGEVFGFIGPNGAGKTTTMRILATLDVPCEGEAYVNGMSVVDDPDRVRRTLGFMPDSYGTYSNVNCEEYLDFFARSYGLRGAKRRAALRHTMAFTQLDRLAQKPVDGLSKGMRQRLCLGRALIHDPQVLILDEPAAGLDPRARIELREMIATLAEQGKSLLISSHILTELGEMCDRVAIIEQGRLLAVGTVEEILHGLEDSQSESGKGKRPPCRIAISIAGPIEPLQQWLADHWRIEAVPLETSSGNLTAARDQDQATVEFDFRDDLEQQRKLLAELVRAGLPITQFAQRQKSLEEAFMHVTRGLVQ